MENSNHYNDLMKTVKGLILKSVICNLLIFNLFISPAFAVEVAPRISDREIIKELADIRIEQAKIREGQVDIRGDIKEIRAEIRGLQQQINDLKESTQQQINDLKESTNKRFDTLQWLLSLFITVALSIMGIMGKILWNQQKKLTQIETSLEAQKEEISFLKTLIEKLQTLIEKLLPPRGVL